METGTEGKNGNNQKKMPDKAHNVIIKVIFPTQNAGSFRSVSLKQFKHSNKAVTMLNRAGK